MSYHYNFPDMQFTLDFIQPQAVCAEIGVWKGEFSKEILKREPSKLYLIDPWKSIADVPERWHAAPQEEMDKVYNEVIGAFGGRDNVEVVRKFSADAAADIQDGSLDWVYVDGDHSYEFVKQDLELWWPKLKPGGCICGDDYQEGKYQVEVLKFGVVKAVNEFTQNNSAAIKLFKCQKDQFAIVKNS